MLISKLNGTWQRMIQNTKDDTYTGVMMGMLAQDDTQAGVILVIQGRCDDGVPMESHGRRAETFLRATGK